MLSFFGTPLIFRSVCLSIGDLPLECEIATAFWQLAGALLAASALVWLFLIVLILLVTDINEIKIGAPSFKLRCSRRLTQCCKTTLSARGNLVTRVAILVVFQHVLGRGVVEQSLLHLIRVFHHRTAH